MDHVVYYFSGTGNSLQVVKELERRGANARSIVKELEDAMENSKGVVTCNAKRVGFVFPLYYLGLPEILHRFMKAIFLPNVTYVYQITTMGWKMRGGAISQTKQYLAAKGISLSMGVYFHMPMNDFTYATVCKPQRQTKILAQFEQKMNSVWNNIQGEKNHFDREPFKFLTKKENSSFCNKVKEADQNFYVTKECTGCGICEKVCSCKNLKLVNKKPAWNHECQGCLACFHYCPSHAIHYRGKESAQYHNPQIDATEKIKW